MSSIVHIEDIAHILKHDTHLGLPGGSLQNTEQQNI